MWKEIKILIDNYNSETGMRYAVHQETEFHFYLVTYDVRLKRPVVKKEYSNEYEANLAFSKAMAFQKELF